MSSEIRVNKINNRAGLGTITIADTGVVVNGIVTCTEISGLNALNIAGVVTATDLTVEKTGNLNVNIKSTSGWGALEVGGSVAGYIDIKKPFSDDYDIRLMADGNNNYITSNARPLKLSAQGAYGIELGAYGAPSLQYNNDTKLTTTIKGIQVGTGVTIETNGQATYTGIVTASAFKLSDGSNVGGVDSDTNDNTTGGTDAGSNLDISSPSAAQGNTLFGHDVGKAITTGEQNTAVGNQAMLSSQTADYNSVFGRQALQNNVSGHQNTAVGNYALNETTSSFNTAVGAAAMYRCTGQDNSALGKSAGKNQQITGNNNTLIGHDSELSSANVSNEITLGDSNISLFRIPGINLTIGNNGANIAGVVTATSFSGDGSNLSNLPAGAPVGGASTNTVFFENDKVVAVNYQITSTKNAMSAGPISINAGIAVTVPSGCSWTIV